MMYEYRIASYDVASNICQALDGAGGTEEEGGRRRSLGSRSDAGQRMGTRSDAAPVVLLSRSQSTGAGGQGPGPGPGPGREDLLGRFGGSLGRAIARVVLVTGVVVAVVCTGRGLHSFTLELN